MTIDQLGALMSYREVTRADQLEGVAYIGLMIVFNVVTAIVLVTRNRPIGLMAWLVLCFGGSLFLLVRWHARNTAYRCGECDWEFEISFFTDFISPHIPNKKYLKCPHCNEKTWAEILIKVD